MVSLVFIFLHTAFFPHTCVNNTPAYSFPLFSFVVFGLSCYVCSYLSALTLMSQIPFICAKVITLINQIKLILMKAQRAAVGF